ncbi:DOMON-like domain-containing protein [Spirulina sp. CCNP1310]|uniref:DOMON-like domain-containing protein n=1 Tax=Spirulina sp. CCNP1310 TaxID=3110249 RepID=UPI002B20FBEE|nr:DOMON-like domain-containing protein [Spirulina sp. CCNP1310]MEA5419008.1 DOMON-like domain-containing protein [Spirulina sp. CCNP1310]
MANFTLHPFESVPFPLRMTGTVERAANLAITYDIAGDLTHLYFPPPETPRRADRLWETTCLEAFIAIPGSDAYWELNLSPSGAWQLYRFESYRSGMAVETGISDLTLQIDHNPTHFNLSVELDLNALGLADQLLELGITAVIATAAGELSYWALHHPGPVADFHDRQGFQL